jgi:hypothetical protein
MMIPRGIRGADKTATPEFVHKVDSSIRVNDKVSMNTLRPLTNFGRELANGTKEIHHDNLAY